MDKHNVKNISPVWKKCFTRSAREIEGKKYLYDKCRQKKVAATPEEYVRQMLVSYFRWILHTPIRYIQTEVSMKSYGYTNRKDRADILILRPDGNTILAVIECKASNIEINGAVTEQMLRYAKALNTEYAFAANGRELVSYRFDKKKSYVQVECPGSYREMCSSFENTVPQVKTIYERPELEMLNDTKFVRKTYDDYIGRETREELLPFAANLCDGLRDISVCLEPGAFSGFVLEKDLGVRTLEITVPGGARFRNNNYRVFTVSDQEGKKYDVGFAVSVYGQSEKTMLVVAVDDGMKCHHALQLILDSNLNLLEGENGWYYELTHNGKINVGRRGCAKISEVIAFVRKEMPSLVGDDEKIHFGKICSNIQITVTSPEFRKIFDRLISYVLLLEKFRAVKLQETHEFR